MNGYAIGRQNGWLSTNDIREMEDMNPLPEAEGGNLYLVQGLKITEQTVVDEVIPVPDDEAIRAGRELASTEGLLAGISSGAAVYAARLLAVRPEFADKTVVALLPDTGERYLSTELFAFDTYPLD